MEELNKRGINVAKDCPLCCNGNETIEHRFVTCDVARAVWFASDLSLRMDTFIITSMAQWINELFRTKKMLQEGIDFIWTFASIIWSLWTHRNAVIYKGEKPNPLAVLSQARVLQNRWKEAFQGGHIKEKQHNGMHEINYSPFTEDTNYEWNAILAYKTIPNSSRFGFCVFICRGQEQVQMVISRGTEGITKEHGILAMHRLLLMELKRREVSKVLIWTTDKRLIKPFGPCFRTNWKLTPILQDIDSMRKGIQVSIIRKVHNKQTEARRLAEVAASGPTLTLWP